MTKKEEIALKNKRERVGQTHISNEGCIMKIIDYNITSDIIVEFQDENKAQVHTTYTNFKNGVVKNPYHPSVYNIGYYGVGKYKAYENGSNTKPYKFWFQMMNRCYSSKTLKTHPTYKDCTVCEEWHNFQNFAKWYEENYYEISGETMCLDKDILIQNNKIYSPETCCFVPERINLLFVFKNRGELPTGVSKSRKQYSANCSVLDENNKSKRIYLGLYKTIDEAFAIYKEFKETYIKQIADEYVGLIPDELYFAMYNYIIQR